VFRAVALPVVTVASALTMTACGSLNAVNPLDRGDDAAAPNGRNDIKVALLLPTKATARYEKYDYPLFKQRVASLTSGKGQVVYENAEANAAKQSRQFAQMIERQVDLIVVDAVDAKAIAPDVRKAKEAGIPVIAYDRLAQGPIAAYVSHDNELVGEVQGRAITEALGDEAATSKIVMINGSPADPNSALFKAGALSELKGRVLIAKSYDVNEWLPATANADMRDAIRAVGLDNIAAVYSANDGMAGAAIEALKSAGATKLPPVTGQDANLDAVQRIVAGEQSMTVYKSFRLEATNAAEIAVAKVQGRNLQFDALTEDSVDSPTNKGIPAMLVPVVAVTKSNIESTVIQDGVYTVKEICTPEYASDCAAIGLK